MAVRTKVLFSGDAPQAAAPGTTLYTAPVGETAILKDLSVRATAATTIELRVGTVGVLAVFFTRAMVAAEVTRLNGLFMVLQPGMVITATSTAGSVRLHMSGTELEGIAD